MQLWDVPPDKIHAPDVCVEDFKSVLGTSYSSVSKDELEEYEKWTRQFGKEGA